MPRHFLNPARKQDGDHPTNKDDDEIRARLLKMIVASEESRKPKAR